MNESDFSEVLTQGSHMKVSSVPHLAVPVATDKACSATTHKEFCSCQNGLQQYCLLPVFYITFVYVYHEFTSDFTY